jgi:hypothetical protein
MFLTGENIDLVNNIFCEKKTKGKNYIPVGVNILEFKSVDRRKTKNGKDMYVFKMYKPPQETSRRATKVSYKPIYCYHIVGGGGNLKDNWYKSFTTVLSQQQLEGMRAKIGSKFKAIVSQTINYIKNSSGEFEYNFGGKAFWADCKIENVYGLDEEVEVNYLKLFHVEE